MFAILAGGLWVILTLGRARARMICRAIGKSLDGSSTGKR
jgi:hypothetical protein